MSTIVLQLPEHRRLRAGVASGRSGRAVASARVHLRHEQRRHRGRRPGPGRGGAAPGRLDRDRRGPGGRRQLASHHLAEGAAFAPALGAHRRARGSPARRRGDGPPRGRAARRRRPADLGRGGRQGVAAGRARGPAERRRLRRSGRADGLARRSTLRPLPRPGRVGRRHARKRRAHLVQRRWRRHGPPRRRARPRDRPFTGTGRHPLVGGAAGRERGRALARRAGQRHADRAAAAAGRPESLEPAPVRPRTAHPRRTRARRLAAPGDEPGLAAGADRHCPVAVGADRRPQSLGLASAERDRRAQERDPGAGQEDLPARRRRRRPARRSGGDAARDAVAAHPRGQGRRERPRADAAGGRRGLAGRASTGRQHPLRARQAHAPGERLERFPDRAVPFCDSALGVSGRRERRSAGADAQARTGAAA